MKRRFGSKIGIDWPFEIMKATPRKAAIVPSVAITALTRPSVMIRPLTAPITAPTPMPNRMARAVEPVAGTASAMHTVDMPRIEPTEISRPPETITIVCALASTPRMAIAWPMLEMLRAKKNTSGRSMPKIATRQARAIRRLKLCVPIAWMARTGADRPRGEPLASTMVSAPTSISRPSSGSRPWRDRECALPSPQCAADPPRSGRRP